MTIQQEAPVIADIRDAWIGRSIRLMWGRYADPLTLDDLADAAHLSKFYYSRVFRAATGTSPGRFLTAVRMYTAKRLLHTTSASVTEIAYAVGYNSLGTFSSRFTRSVGLPPARYRSLTGDHLGRRRTSPGIHSRPAVAGPTGTVTGWVTPAAGDGGRRTYVAAFEGPGIEGLPSACQVIAPGQRHFRLDVPEGIWFVRAAAVEQPSATVPPIRGPRLIGAAAPLRVRSGVAHHVDLAMRTPGILDLPILLALPELDAPAGHFAA